MLTAGLISATSTITSAANVTGGNITTAGLITATGNVTGGNLLTAGQLSATANVTGGNVLTAGIMSSTGNATHGNILTGGIVSATGNIYTANTLVATGAATTGDKAAILGNVANVNLHAQAVAVLGGNANGSVQFAFQNYSALSNASTDLALYSTAGTDATYFIDMGITGNTYNGTLNGANILGAGDGYLYVVGNNNQGPVGTGANVGNLILGATNGQVITFLGNLSTANIITTVGSNGFSVNGVVSATGNIIANTGSFFIGNGSQLTGVTATSAGFPITAGTSNISATNNGNIAITVGGTANVAVFATTGEYVTGLLSVSGNVTGGNVLTGGVVSATGNINSGGNIYATTSISTGGFLSSTGNVITNQNALISGYSSAVGNVIGGNILTAGIVSATANITGGNVLTAGLISATGNVTGNYINGNGYFLTGIITSVANINNGTSNVNIAAANANVTVSVNGTSNVAVFATTGEYITGVLSATGNITGGNVLTGGLVSATANITGGNLLSGGLASVTGNITGGNIQTAGLISATGAITSVANVTGGNLLTAGQVSAAGNVYANNIVTSGSGGSISGTGNITAGNFFTGGVLSATGNITGNYVLGNGYFLTGVITSVANINNGTSNVNIAAANANVTVSVNGTSNVAVFANTGLLVTGFASASGNVTGGNILTGGIISATGNITAGADISIVGNIVDTGTFWLNTSANGNINLNPNGTGQTNIPAGLLNVTANIVGGNLLTGGAISATGNIRGGNVTASNFYYANGIAIVNYTASTTPPSSPTTGWQWYNTTTDVLYEYITDGTTPYWVDISSPAFAGGVVANVSISGNILNNANATYDIGSASQTFKNVYAQNYYGNGATLTGIVTSVSNINNGTSNITAVSSGGNITASIGGTSNVVVWATTGEYVTGVISASGNITGGNLTVSTGTVTVGNIVNANGNAVGNIGSSSNYFNTIFGKATTAQYADLAEVYASDADYAPGTVLVFGGEQEVTISTTDLSRRVAGVVSTNPAHLMNATLESEHKVSVALTGRVPTRVTGTVRKGDMMVSTENGCARAEAEPLLGSVIGKALEDFDGVEGTIEIVVGRM